MKNDTKKTKISANPVSNDSKTIPVFSSPNDETVPLFSAKEDETERVGLSGAAPTKSPEERLGETILGYRVTGLLGVGGEGAVYRAEKDGEVYALKIKKVDHQESPEEKEEAAATAQAIIALEKEKPDLPLVPLLAYEKLPGGETIVVMPYFEEGSLADLFTPRVSDCHHPEAMSPRKRAFFFGKRKELALDAQAKEKDKEAGATLSLAFIRQVVLPEMLMAMHALHEAGVIHGDIKPDNIYLSADHHHIFLGDFGIASRLSSSELSSVTQIHYAKKKGFTNRYAPPSLTNRISASFDYYCLGTTLDALVMRRRPYDEASDEEFSTKLEMEGFQIYPEIKTRDYSLAELIARLTPSRLNEIPSYEAILSWLKDPESDRVIKGAFSQDPDVIPHSFKLHGERYYSIPKLVQAFYAHFDLALACFTSQGVLPSIYEGRSDRVEEILELNRYFTLYGKNSDERENFIGAFLSLFLLAPRASFTYDGHEYGDFAGILKAIKASYPNFRGNEWYLQRPLLEGFVNGHFCGSLLAGEIESWGRSHPEEEKKRKRILLSIAVCFQHFSTPLEQAEMLLNYFSEDESLYIDGLIYPSLPDFALAQNVQLEPDGKLPFSEYRLEKGEGLPFFYSLFTGRFHFEMAFVADLLKSPSFRYRHLALARKILGKLPFEWDGGITISNLADFLSYVADFFGYTYVENKHPPLLLFLQRSMEDGLFQEINALEDQPNRELEAKVFSYPPERRFAALYFLTAAHPRFRQYQSPDEIVAALNASKDIASLSKELMADPNLELFLQIRFHPKGGN